LITDQHLSVPYNPCTHLVPEICHVAHTPECYLATIQVDPPSGSPKLDCIPVHQLAPHRHSQSGTTNV